MQIKRKNYTEKRARPKKGAGYTRRLFKKGAGLYPNNPYIKPAPFLGSGHKIFAQFCKSNSRRKVCEFLTAEFGWYVDEHSLGANQNRLR